MNDVDIAFCVRVRSLPNKTRSISGSKILLNLGAGQILDSAAKHRKGYPRLSALKLQLQHTGSNIHSEIIKLNYNQPVICRLETNQATEYRLMYYSRDLERRKPAVLVLRAPSLRVRHGSTQKVPSCSLA
jgi:hypothetical protein